MANIMVRKSADGSLTFYLPKRDIEDSITAIEFDTPEKWGGEIKLGNGGVYYIDPQPLPARFPISLRVKRVDGVE